MNPSSPMILPVHCFGYRLHFLKRFGAPLPISALAPLKVPEDLSSMATPFLLHSSLR